MVSCEGVEDEVVSQTIRLLRLVVESSAALRQFRMAFSFVISIIAAVRHHTGFLQQISEQQLHSPPASRHERMELMKRVVVEVNHYLGEVIDIPLTDLCHPAHNPPATCLFLQQLARAAMAYQRHTTRANMAFSPTHIPGARPVPINVDPPQPHPHSEQVKSNSGNRLRWADQDSSSSFSPTLSLSTSSSTSFSLAPAPLSLPTSDSLRPAPRLGLGLPLDLGSADGEVSVEMEFGSEDSQLWLRASQEALQPLVDRPILTTDMLTRPPFKLIHRIVMAVMEKTGFLKGLFFPHEFEYSYFQDAKSRISFLTRLIEAVRLTLHLPAGHASLPSPSHIVAGRWPKKTNIFLQKLAQAANLRVNFEDILDQIERLHPVKKKVAWGM
eukprot:TRINITY_DN3886_c0_g1_i2.p1 TRINITY_DN3886_c0_g1~~TRINITY_DN3886_c0_g1_i2.p1  ORF type:complete len:384 (+),score=103.73 TRINITY_DN3886_c0_g1_i2:73-1224(+)